MTRRSILLGAVTARIPGAEAVRVEHRGVFLQECRHPGETRADNVFPAHPSGLRLSRDRYLFLYATRGWRGVDEDRSIVYEVRAGGYAGRTLGTGLLAQSSDQWDALGDGKLYVRSQGAPAAFGVPKGARIGGRVPAHANLFVAKWYRYARAFAAPGRLFKAPETQVLSTRTLGLEHVQFRLNQAEDDIEILQPRSVLRQVGYETGDRKCSASPNEINHSLVSPVPFNSDASEWIDAMHFGGSEQYQERGGSVVSVKYRYSAAKGRYEWVETGPVRFAPECPGFEAATVRLKDSWAIVARPIDKTRPALWLRLDDPFTSKAGRIRTEVSEEHPPQVSPVTAYACPDGVVRILAGDSRVSPYKMARNPLFLYDVDPGKGFARTRRRTVVDLVKAGVPMRVEAGPMADMAKLLPHAGGREHVLVHRVRTNAIGVEGAGRMVATETEKEAHGIYHARVVYDAAYPDVWNLA